MQGSQERPQGLNPAVKHGTASHRIGAAVRSAVVASAIAAAGASFAASAQTASTTDQGSELQEVVVTGSRISRPDLEQAAPVTVVTSDEIVKSGLQSIGDILQRLPAITGSPENGNNNNGGDGAARADIRGFGDQRTLVLLNGRRVVYGSGTVGPGNSVDLNMIPVSMIDHVEVEKNGASTVYGADAVTGVVNIITKSNVQGLYISGEAGETSRHDGQNAAVHVYSGTSTDNARFSWGGDYTDQKAVLQSARSWSDHAEYMTCADGSSQEPCPGGNLIHFGGSSGSLFGRVAVAAGNALGLTPGNYVYDPTNPAAIDGYAPYSTAKYSYNYNALNYLTIPSEREQFWFQGEYDLVPGVTAFGEAIYYHRESTEQLAPNPYGPAVYGNPGYLLTGVNNPDVAGQQGISASNFYNPFQQDIADVRIRLAGFGNRDYNQSVDTDRIVAGFKGKLFDRFSWETSINFGRNDIGEAETGQLLGGPLANADGPSFGTGSDGKTYLNIDQVPAGVKVVSVTCGTPANPITGCVSFNVFNGQSGLTQAMKGYLAAPIQDFGSAVEKDFLNYISGDILPLPAGQLAANVGFEYRVESGFYHFDTSQQTNESTAGLAVNTDGAYNAKEEFIEVRAPIVKDLPFAHSVDVQVGGRFSQYSSFGNTNNGMGGIVWKPTTGVEFRGSYTMVYRVPSINELFQGEYANFPTGNDPCGNSPTPAQQVVCAANGVPGGSYVQSAGQPLEYEGGTSTLKPETGFNKTVGLVLTPSFVPGFDMTLDWYDVYLKHVILSPNASDILANCANTGSATTCGLIQRYADGEINQILGLNINGGFYTSQGFDFQFDYKRSTPIGNFSAMLAGTYLVERDVQTLPGDPVIHDAGTFDSVSGIGDSGSGGAFPRMRGEFELNWQQGPLSLQFYTLYIGAYDEVLADDNANGGALIPQANGYIRRVGSFISMDALANYAWGKGTSVTFKVFNLADHNPPYVESGFSANTDTTYPQLGREFQISAAYKF